MTSRINAVCYTTSLLSILMATVLTIAMIWIEEASNDVVVKTMLTCCVVFVASAGILVVNSTLTRLFWMDAGASQRPSMHPDPSEPT